MIFTKLWYILFDCICTTVNTFVPLLYSKIKITWNIYHLASEWVNTFICMKRKYGKCLEVEEGAGRVVPYTGFGSHPWALPLWLSRLRTQLVSMRMWVRPLASLSGSRIQSASCCDGHNSISHRKLLKNFNLWYNMTRFKFEKNFFFWKQYKEL